MSVADYFTNFLLVLKDYFFVLGIFYFFYEQIQKWEKRKKIIRARKVSLLEKRKIESEKEQEKSALKNRVLHFPYQSFFIAARQHLLQVQYGKDVNAEARQASVLIWHDIVLTFQEKYCENLLNSIELTGVEFEYAVKKYSQDHLDLFLETLQKALGDKLEKYYSMIGMPLRNLLEVKIYRILEKIELETPEKILQIFTEIGDYCLCTKAIAEGQVLFNGALTGLSFDAGIRDKETGELIEVKHYKFQ